MNVKDQVGRALIDLHRNGSKTHRATVVLMVRILCFNHLPSVSRRWRQQRRSRGQQWPTATIHIHLSMLVTSSSRWQHQARSELM